MKSLLCPALLATSLVLAALVCPSASAAAVRTWDGSASGFWTNAANWSGSVAPVNGDSLVFPAGPSRLSTTNTIGGATNLTAVTLTGSNYVLRSASLSLTNGLTNTAPVSSVNTLETQLTPRASQTWEVAGKTTLILNSNVPYNALTLTLDAVGAVEVNGSFVGGGSANLTKLGNGRLELNGAANALSQVRVGEGALEVDGALLATSLIISNGALLSGTGTVSAFTTSGDIKPGTVSGSDLGVLAVSGGAASFFQPGGRLTVELHSPIPGPGQDQLKVAAVPDLTHGALSVLRDSGFPLSVGQKFVIITNTAGGSFTTTFTNLPQNARITNFLAPVTIFEISYTGGSGNDVELTVVDVAPTPTGVARVWDGDAVPNLNWTNAANWAANTLPAQGDDLVFPATVAVNRRAMVNAFSDGTTFNRLVFAGANNGWNLSGGLIKLLGGIVATNSLAQLSFSSISAPVELAASQTFVATNATLFFGTELRLGGNTLTISLPTNGFVSCFCPVTGSGGIVMSGDGILNLRGSNSFTGPLTIQGGTVDVDHPNNGSAPWQLTGGTLNLIGASIPGLQATGGTLAAGFEGNAQVAGNLSLSAASIFQTDALGSTVSNVPLAVTGSVNLGGATLVLGGLRVDQIGQTLFLLRKDSPGAISNTFAGLPQGAIFPVTNEDGFVLSAQISYLGGDGNDVSIALLTPTPTGTTRVWSGAGGDRAWVDAGNWLNGAPGNGDSLLFPPNVSAVTNESIPPVMIDRLTWTGSNYVHSGPLVLLGGVSAGQSAGTNTFEGQDLFTFGPQTWAVSNAAATVLCVGSPFQGGWSGTGTILKTGAGTLSLRNLNLFLRSNLLQVDEGALRLRGVGTEQTVLQLTGGQVDAADSSFDTVAAFGGELLVTLRSEPGFLPKAGLDAALITLKSNVTLTVLFANTSVKESFLSCSTIDLGGARLNPVPVGTESVGDIILLVRYEPGGLTNGFANLLEGAVTNIAGFGLQIHYADTIPDSGGLFVTLTVLSLPAPQFTQLQRLASGDVILRGTFLPNATIFLEGTQDFQNWTQLGSTVSSGAGIFTFLDSTGLPFRFYRAYRQ